MSGGEGYYLCRRITLADHGGFGRRARHYEQAYYWTGHDWSEWPDRRLTIWGDRRDAQAVFGPWRTDVEVALDFERMAPVPPPEASGVRLVEATMTADDLTDARKLEMADDDRRLWPSRAKRW